MVARAETSEQVRSAVPWHRRWRRLAKRKFWPWSLWTVGAVAVGALIVGLILDVAGVHWWQGSEHTCDSSHLGCDLGVHVVGTGIVAALSFALIFLRREGQAAAKWRRKARRHPERLLGRWLPPDGGVTGLAIEAVPGDTSSRRSSNRFPWVGSGDHPQSSLIENVISRDRIAREIADDLDDGPGTQLLVGPTGSGKTMVLLKLAPLLARQGLVPIPFSMRDMSHEAKRLDLEGRAREAYRREYSDRTEEEAEKQWRWLIRGGQIVLIVDDLEKARARPNDVVQALEDAGSVFRVVAATRPSGISIRVQARADRPRGAGPDPGLQGPDRTRQGFGRHDQ